MQALNPPRQWIHSDGSRFFQATLKQNLLLRAIEVSHRNGFSAKVGPIQVLVDPVHRNSHWILDVVNHFVMSAGVHLFVQHSAVRNQRRKSDR